MTFITFRSLFCHYTIWQMAQKWKWLRSKFTIYWYMYIAHALEKDNRFSQWSMICWWWMIIKNILHQIQNLRKQRAGECYSLSSWASSRFTLSFLTATPTAATLFFSWHPHCGKHLIDRRERARTEIHSGEKMWGWAIWLLFNTDSLIIAQSSTYIAITVTYSKVNNVFIYVTCNSTI